MSTETPGASPTTRPEGVGQGADRPGARRRPGGARPNGPLLELSQIIDAAAELTAEHGLDRVSMRQLGDRLGVTSMAIYWYIENRSALIDSLLERVCGTIELPEAALAWDHWLIELSRRGHEVLRAYPGLADELLSTPRRPPSVVAIMTAARTRLVDEGLSDADAATSVAVLGSFVVARAQIDACASRQTADGTAAPLAGDVAHEVLEQGVRHIVEGIRRLADA